MPTSSVSPVTPSSSGESASPTTASASSGTAFEDFTYADVRPMLTSHPGRQTLALTQIATLAGRAGSLSVAQAADAVTMAVDLVAFDSPSRSPSELVRLDAIIALRAIGSRPDLVCAIPAEVRIRAFDVLCELPVACVKVQQTVGSLSSEVSLGMRETDPDVRKVSDHVAGMYSETAVRGRLPITQLETAPSLPSLEPPLEQS